MHESELHKKAKRLMPEAFGKMVDFGFVGKELLHFLLQEYSDRTMQIVWLMVKFYLLVPIVKPMNLISDRVAATVSSFPVPAASASPAPATAPAAASAPAAVPTPASAPSTAGTSSDGSEEDPVEEYLAPALLPDHDPASKLMGEILHYNSANHVLSMLN